jgi:hypothetical protein
MSFLSERTQPIVMANIIAGTSYTVANSASVNLSDYGCDSLLVVATVSVTTGNGFTMTAQGGATTSALGGYCVTPGSTATLLTVSCTAAGKVCYLDLKNVPHKYVGVKHTGLGALTGVIHGYPYDSKSQKISLSADLASTAVGSGYYTSVNPTTA